MLNKITEYIPAQSLIILFICIGGILLFAFLLIIPRQNLASELDQSIVELENKIGEQRTLTPVFYQILSLAKKKSNLICPSLSRLNWPAAI